MMIQDDAAECLSAELSGCRPNKTTHQILSLAVFAVEVRAYTPTEWYFTDGSTLPESGASKPPTYATQWKHTTNIKL